MIQLPAGFQLDLNQSFVNAEAHQELINQGWWQDFKRAMEQWLAPHDTFVMHTSGSTGKPKPIVLSKAAARASAQMTLRHLNIPEGPLFVALPMTTMGGWMMAVRAMEGHRPLWLAPPSRQPLAHSTETIAMASLVPYQLEHSMSDLGRCHTLLVGGAPLLKPLEGLEGLNTIIYLTYGMTETYSHVALRRLHPHPETTFEALPGVTFDQEGEALVIRAPHLNLAELRTNDAVVLNDSTHFQWLGRTDFVINSGGIKVHPEQMESRLMELLDAPFYVIGIPDAQFGERPALVVEGSVEGLTAALFSNFQPWERPIKAFGVTHLPTSEGGKLKRLAPSLLDHLLGVKDFAIGR
jgi:O-succinylbenzoic acid--CoA ligase